MPGADDLLAAARARMMPPGRMLPSVWADSRRRLSSEASAEAGRWSTARAPFQAAMMDAVATHQTVVLATASQMGKTECLLNVLGAWIETDPGPVLVVQPTLEMARVWSRDRLAPMIAATPALAALFPAVKSRARGQAVLRREFKGGQLSLAGANAAAGLASRPVRFLLLDECDRFPEQAGSEGDPVTIATQRTANFWNRKVIMASTPTTKGASRIWAAYEASTMAAWHVPCPKCGVLHPLEWAGVKWDKGAPESARMVCPRGCEFGEREKKEAVLKGRWIESNPGHATAGFRINALASPWASVSTLVAEFLEAKSNPQRLKAFANLRLGEPWEDQSEGVEVSTLAARCVEYGCATPAGVRAITAGVDVQRDRLHCEIVGWGEGPEAWGLGYHVLSGDTNGPVPWAALDELLKREHVKQDGARLKVAHCGVDASFNTDAVHRYCMSRAAMGVFMAFGSTLKAAGVIERGMRRRRMGFMIGVHQIKETFYGRLKLNAASGAGALHWPIGRGYDAAYFLELTAEELRARKRFGRKVWDWHQIRERNEALDCRVLAMAGLGKVAPEVLKAQPAPAPLRKAISNSFVNSWRD